MKYYSKIREISEGKAEFAKVEVYYSKGGINYSNYKNEGRGIYVAFSKVERSQERGYQTESFMMFDKSSFKVLVKELGRKSQKTINEVSEKVRNIADDLAEQFKSGNYQIAVSLV